MEIWQDNLSILRTKNKQLAEKINEYKEEHDRKEICTRELEDGSRILGLNRSNHTWYFNSRLDPEGASAIYVDRYKIEPFYRYFIFGFADGRIVRKLLNKCDSSNIIIICEPNIELLIEAMIQYDLTDIFEDHRVWVCISEDWKDIQVHLYNFLEYSYINMVEFCILPGYDILYPKECEKYMDYVLERVQGEIFNRATYVYFDRKAPNAILTNMRYMIEHRNVAQIKKSLEQVNVEKIPAVILSAGPSLDKNIKEVKRLEKKVFIIVVDAALRTVLRENIHPDLVCTIDVEAPERFFEGAENADIAWVCTRVTNPWILRTNGKKVFYVNGFLPWWDRIIQNKTDYALASIEMGGSVATTAYSLASYLGFKTIIFAGLDLAFTGGQSHTNGIEGVLGENDEYIQGRKLVRVKDAEGNWLETDYQMFYYKEWFEKKLKSEKELKVIDATEGGAKIEGMRIQTLHDTLEEECSVEVDFSKYIDEIPTLFSGNCQKELYQSLQDMNKNKEDFLVAVGEGILQQEEFLKRLKCESVTDFEKAQKLREMVEFNRKIESHTFTECIGMYAVKEEYELREVICKEADMEIEEIVERSLTLLRAYKNAIPMFDEDFAEALS